MKVFAIVLTILIVVMIVATVAFYFVSASIYDNNFDFRCTTSEENSLSLSDFPGLTRTRYTFKSNKGQTLVGYLYEHQGGDKKGVVVFAHGLGAGGQRGYMDLFDFFSSKDYYVFAYDATGNDESEGDVIGGLPQGIIDLDYAIDTVYTIDETKDLPILLAGYSWGAMSVTNVLNYHPEVKAVAALAGFNRSLDLIEHEGVNMVGDVARIMIPFASLHEFIKYGNYAFSTSMDGFAKSECNVMIVHGEKDDIVPIEYGYGTYYEKYAEDERFLFKKYEHRDHDIMTYVTVDALDINLMADIVAFFDKSIAK